MPKPPLRQRLQELFATYGKVAVVLYFSIFGVVLGGFMLAIQAGVDVKGAAQGAGTFAAAYIATKVTQPVRIAATLALTPLVAHALERLRRSNG